MRFLILVSLFAFSCSSIKKTNFERVKTIDQWFYQLQKYSKEIKGKFSRSDSITVVDPDEIKTVTKDFKDKSSDTLILAYLSIGEAEEYRKYFSSMDKNLILYENPHWKGNFKVKFWDKRWQDIIFSRVESLIDEGYDGVYLDIVDAFYEIKPHYKRAAQMRDFLLKIKKHSQAKRKDFLIFQQNAPTLYQYLPTNEIESYFDILDGLALEDCFFYGNNDHDNPLNTQGYCLESIRAFSKREKTILSVEYLTEKSKIREYFESIKEFNKTLNGNKVIPLVAKRPLDGD